MKKKILAIMMAGIATCTVFAVCGKTESDAIGSQVSTSTETVTMTLEQVAKATEIKVNTLYAKSATKSTGYTYSDLSKTMYAKSTVNVRSLPSTSGSKLGSLSKKQEVAVTGQCNETGWYRISYNNGDGFVSDKYLVDTPVAKTANVAQAQTGAKTTSSSSTGDPVTDAAIAKYGPNIMIFEDGTIYSTETWQQVGTVDGTGTVADYTKPAEHADGYDRTIAEQVWAKVNAERTTAGLNALAWDENAYNFACSRAQDIITDFSHNGHGIYGENIYKGSVIDADAIHTWWYNSPVHHENYMDPSYGSGACAAYVYNGMVYAVENFSYASSPQTDPYAGNQNREVNGETVDLSGQQAEAFDNGNTWTASNGIVVYVESGGNLSCNAVGDEATAALLEYIDTH